MIKLVLPAEPATVTKFTLIVAADALMFVAVNLSIIVVTPVAVYWVVCEFSANFAGTRTLTVTVMVYSKRRQLLAACCMMTQFVPSDTIVAQLPTTAKRIAVPGVVLSIGTILLDAELTNWACMFFTVI